MLALAEPVGALARVIRCIAMDPSRRHVCVLAAACVAPAAWAAPATTSMVAVPQDVWEDHRRFLNGRYAHEVTFYGGPGARRDVIELVLLQQALRLGGWREGLFPLTLPTDVRLLHEVAIGHAVLAGTTYWLEDIRQEASDLVPSSAWVAPGEFEVGVYVRPGNRRALAVRSAQALRGLSAVSCRDWRVDWRTLSAMGLKALLHAPSWDSMPAMVAAGRADFLLAPFQPNADMSLTVGSVRLVPVPGLKVRLAGTRHVPLSRHAPQFERVHASLELGLRQMRARGVIRRAYTESGFFNARVSGWTVV